MCQKEICEKTAKETNSRISARNAEVSVNQSNRAQLGESRDMRYESSREIVEPDGVILSMGDEQPEGPVINTGSNNDTNRSQNDSRRHRRSRRRRYLQQSVIGLLLPGVHGSHDLSVDRQTSQQADSSLVESEPVNINVRRREKRETEFAQSL